MGRLIAGLQGIRQDLTSTTGSTTIPQAARTHTPSTLHADCRSHESSRPQLLRRQRYEPQIALGILDTQKDGLAAAAFDAIDCRLDIR